MEKNKRRFLLFGVLQMVTIGVLIYLIFHSLSKIHGAPIIGLDSQIIISVLTPVTMFIIEYMIYTK